MLPSGDLDSMPSGNESLKQPPWRFFVGISPPVKFQVAGISISRAGSGCALGSVLKMSLICAFFMRR